MICPKCNKVMSNIYCGSGSYAWKCVYCKEVYEQRTIETLLFITTLEQQVESLKYFLLDFGNDISLELYEQLSNITNNLQLIIKGGKQWIGLEKNQK